MLPFRTLRNRIVKVAEAPQTIGDARSHRWGATQCPMHADEVVNRTVHGGRSGKVLDLFGEAERQSRESFHKRADREIVPLDMARANRAKVAYPVYVYPLGPRQSRRSVTARVVSVLLYQDAMPDSSVEVTTNRGQIGLKTVGAQLGPILAQRKRNNQAFLEVANERVRGLPGPLANRERNEQLGFGVESGEEILVATASRVEIPLPGVTFLDPAERPNFVELDVRKVQIDEPFVKEISALSSEPHDKPHDCVAADLRDPLDAPNAVAFGKQLQRLNLPFLAQEIGHGPASFDCGEPW